MVLWRAPHTDVKIADASTVTVTTAALLDSFTSGDTDIDGKMKSVTIVVPEGDVEGINLLGTESIVGSNFQTMILDQKPFGLAELSGTLVLDGDEILTNNSKHLFFGSATAVSGTHSRYRAGSVTTGANDRPQVTIAVNLTDGTDEVTMLLDNAYITKMGDIKIDSADGHWEFDVTMKCKPGDFHMEWKD